MMREVARIRQMSDRLNSRVDHMSRQTPVNKGGGGGGNKGGGGGGNKGGGQDGNGKRGRGGNDNYQPRDQPRDNRRQDEDGRTYIKVRKGGPRSDGHKNRSSNR